MKTILNSFLFSKIISVSILFFQTFCKKILRFLRIINLSHPQLSKLTCFCFHKAPSISLSAIFFFTELVSLERIYIAISLMVSFAVNTLEAMQIQLTTFYFES